MSATGIHPLELAVLDRLGIATEAVEELVRRDHHSNLVAAARLTGGRRLIVKRARDPRLARFARSSLASRLLQSAGVLAPVHLPLGDLPADEVIAYWWLPHPTLDRVWRAREDKRALARSWGAMTRRIHGVRLPGHGPIEALVGGLRRFLELDLAVRLRPAVAGAWPAALPALDELLGRLDEVPSAPPALVHGDLFDRNVVVDRRTDAVVGVLDLEDVSAGPPEMDLARTELLHGPLFRDPIAGDWFAQVVAGAGYRPEPRRMSCFRITHLLNMGFHAAVAGYADHAADLVDALDAELGAFGAGRSHRDVLGSPGARPPEEVPWPAEAHPG